MVLYICLMASIESVPGEEVAAVGAQSPRSPVSGGHGHLRTIPQAPGDFRVVLTFHHADGKLCEAVLSPLEASMIVSEVAHVLEEGDRQAMRRQQDH